MIRKKVVVTTEYRGVFFGILKSEDGNTVVLENAKNCIYWSASVRGFVGLANSGPDESCKVGPSAPQMKLHKVTAILEATEEAAKRWEDSPWR